MSLTVLITNICMDWPSGTVIYARDLALELQRQGHRPIVYTWLKGRASSELAAAGVEVVDSLWQIHDQPDVIHGHHRPLVRGALLRFPGVPAVSFCHNPSDPWDAPAPTAIASKAALPTAKTRSYSAKSCSGHSETRPTPRPTTSR